MGAKAEISPIPEQNNRNMAVLMADGRLMEGTGLCCGAELSKANDKCYVDNLCTMICGSIRGTGKLAEAP